MYFKIFVEGRGRVGGGGGGGMSKIFFAGGGLMGKGKQFLEWVQGFKR